MAEPHVVIVGIVSVEVSVTLVSPAPFLPGWGHLVSNHEYVCWSGSVCFAAMGIRGRQSLIYPKTSCLYHLFISILLPSKIPKGTIRPAGPASGKRRWKYFRILAHTPCSSSGKSQTLPAIQAFGWQSNVHTGLQRLQCMPSVIASRIPLTNSCAARDSA